MALQFDVIVTNLRLMAEMTLCDTCPRAGKKEEKRRVGASSEGARAARKLEATGQFTWAFSYYAIARPESLRKSAIDSTGNEGPYF